MVLFIPAVKLSLSPSGWFSENFTRILAKILENADFYDILEFKLNDICIPSSCVLSFVEQFISKVCIKDINMKELKSGSCRGSITKIRLKLAVDLVEEFGISFAWAARHMG